jgi:curved DNA-binding protein CbpA
MVEFNAAWAVLGNPSARAAYDAERTQQVVPTVSAKPPEPGNATGL